MLDNKNVILTSTSSDGSWLRCRWLLGLRLLLRLCLIVLWNTGGAIVLVPLVEISVSEVVSTSVSTVTTTISEPPLAYSVVVTSTTVVVIEAKWLQKKEQFMKWACVLKKGGAFFKISAYWLNEKETYPPRRADDTPNVSLLILRSWRQSVRGLPFVLSVAASHEILSKNDLVLS